MSFVKKIKETTRAGLVKCADEVFDNVYPTMEYEIIFRANNVNGNIMSNVEVTKDGRHYYPNDDLWNILIENGYWPYSSNLSGNIDFVDEDVQLWINASKHRALAWIGPKHLETMDDLATDIEIPDSIPGIANVEMVYIVCKRWSGEFTIPNTVKNIFIDKFSLDYHGQDFLSENGGCIVIGKDNPYLHCENGYAIYTKDKKTLLDFTRCEELFPYKLIEGVETNRKFAFLNMKFIPKRLEVPVSMKSLNARCVEKMGVFPIDINCKGAIKELNIPLDASAVINNYIEDVDCVDRDKQNDCSLVFKSPVPDKSPAVEGCFFLTKAGAATEKIHRSAPWSRKILCKGCDIKSVSPVVLKCYDEHIGCHIELKETQIEYSGFNVYESVDIVLNKLIQCGITDVSVI